MFKINVEELDASQNRWRDGVGEGVNSLAGEMGWWGGGGDVCYLPGGHSVENDFLLSLILIQKVLLTKLLSTVASR